MSEQCERVPRYYPGGSHMHMDISGISGPYAGSREDCVSSWDRKEARRIEALGWQRVSPPEVPSGE
jgi:hypothetical protein